MTLPVKCPTCNQSPDWQKGYAERPVKFTQPEIEGGGIIIEREMRQTFELSCAHRRMRVLSVCSGIEASSCAWSPLGMQTASVAEVERFPSAVLVHRWPDVPNFGDITKYENWPDLHADILVGGTPCQSFSVAGLRAGLRDPRGNLTLTFLGIAQRYLPNWLVWENVPGVFSDATHAFGSFLSGLSELGYGWAYRVLDAQHFGVPQQRRRVFVVGYLGDWRRAAAVLFERESLRGDSAPRREEGQRVAHAIACGSGGSKFGSGRDGQDDFVTHALRGDGFDASEDGTGRGTPLVPVAFDWQGSGVQGDLGWSKEGVGSIGTSKIPAMASRSGVRRLTPLECERLMGFTDGYTAIPGAKDGPRYKALGNSMAVPVMRWIGERILMVDGLPAKKTD